ncbi:MAG TPA: GerMN domain-containing protein [Pyrinomonadaceae bacterium]|nr:GerMN domain-containing protein [Pyrinomonadaceae bacterium]
MVTKRRAALVSFLSFLLLGAGSVLAQRRQQIKVYLVALDDNGKAGKKIGCDDSLVPVIRSIRRTAAPLRATLQELLSTPAESGDNPKLQNFWKGNDLKLSSVSIRNRTATIRFSGELTTAGICDIPRIESQIEETARQFPTVRRVKVFIGQQILRDAIR